MPTKNFYKSFPFLQNFNQKIFSSRIQNINNFMRCYSNFPNLDNLL